jgi:hypothetical protein
VLEFSVRILKDLEANMDAFLGYLSCHVLGYAVDIVIDALNERERQISSTSSLRIEVTEFFDRAFHAQDAQAMIEEFAYRLVKRQERDLEAHVRHLRCGFDKKVDEGGVVAHGGQYLAHSRIEFCDSSYRFGCRWIERGVAAA